VIRVVLVDDQELVREGVRVLCEGDGDIEAFATAQDGLHAQQVVRELAPVRGYSPFWVESRRSRRRPAVPNLARCAHRLAHFR